VGAEPGVALVVVQPLERPTPTAEAGAVFVYGVRVGQATVANDFVTSGFGYSILVDGRAIASNLSERDRGVVEQAALQSGPLPPDGTTVLAEGSRPTVHLRPLTGAAGTAAVLALSRSAKEALRSQRDALATLLLASLATTAVVGGLPCCSVGGPSSRCADSPPRRSGWPPVTSPPPPAWVAVTRSARWPARSTR
jgi:hypothetical protein